MKRKIQIACIGLLLPSLSDAAVLQSWAGPTTVTNTSTLLVDTASDSSDWITTGGYDAGTASTSLYFVFTMNVTNNNSEGAGGNAFYTGFQLGFGAAPSNNTNQRFAVGNNWETGPTWGGFQSVGDGVGGNYSLTGSPTISLSTAATFVMKLDQASNQATIWFNPDLGVAEGSQPSGITTIRTSLGDEDTFDRIYLRAGGGAGSTTFSDMAVHNSSVFAAVPEPSSALLGGLGMMALLRRRRKGE